MATVGHRQQRDRARELLDETRRGLYRILAEDSQEEEVEEDEREV